MLIWQLVFSVLIAQEQFRVEVSPDVFRVTVEQPVAMAEMPARIVDPKDFDFVVFTADYCRFCKQWFKSSERKKLEAAGFKVWSADVKEPQWQRMVGKGLPCFHLVDKKTREPLREWIGFTSFEDLTREVEVDAVCRLSNATFRWSGFAVADERLLTVAHHNTTGRFRAEFPIKGQSEVFVTLFASLGPENKALDVNVLRLKRPRNVKLVPFVLQAGKPKAIDGFADGTTRKVVPVVPYVEPNVDWGKDIVALMGIGISTPQFGMSGSPVLTETGSVMGIQQSGDDGKIWASSLNAIQAVMAVEDKSQ